MNPRRSIQRALLAAALAAAPAAAQGPAPEAPDPASAAPAFPSLPLAEPAGGEPTAAAQEPAPPAQVPEPAPEAAPAQAPAPAEGVSPAAGGTQVMVEGFTIEGQAFETDPETGLITVTGDARAFRGPDEIRATRLVINPRTRQLTAEGNVIIRQAGEEIRATRATYNFETREGRAESAVTFMDQYYVRADQVLIHPGPTYEARRAFLTTCGPDHPHWGVYARVVDIVPDVRLVAQHVGVDLAGVRLATVPRLTRSLRPEREGQDRESLYPRVGYDTENGVYAEKDFTLRRKDPVWVDGFLRLATSREPSAGIMAATPGNLQWVGTVFYRDRSENQRARFLQVSRLPEVGMVWRPNERPRPGRFLAHQIAGVRVPEYLRRSTNWRFAAQLSAGYFIQHPGEAPLIRENVNESGARLLLQGQGILPRAELGPISLNRVRFLARQTVYEGGRTFTVFGTGVGKDWRLGNFRVGLDRLDHFTVGSTPFLFDDVELEEEWRPHLLYRSRSFSFEYFARIRGNRLDLYDQVFSVSKLFHCIEPRISYRTRTNRIEFEIRLPGLSDFSDSPLGEPRTLDTGDPLAETPVETQPR